MRALFCHYDGTSKIPGASLGAKTIWENFFKKDVVCEHHLMPTKNSAIYCKSLKTKVLNGNHTLFIGGEHLVTFPILEVFKEKWAGLKLVVFDAHHDAYDYPLLTHYSVFHHIINEFQIPVLFVGLRYEVERASSILKHISIDAKMTTDEVNVVIKTIENFIGNDPYYISLDLDCLDPEEFSSVSAPVANGMSIEMLSKILGAILSHKTVGMDVVEYNAVKDHESNEIKKLRPIFDIIKNWMKNNASEQ